jgi:hypothetical protein
VSFSKESFMWPAWLTSGDYFDYFDMGKGCGAT